MSKIIVTGGNGFIGSNLKPFLSQHDAEFFFLTRTVPTQADYSNIKYIQCDLLDLNSVSKALKKIKASHLIHLAWELTPSDYNRPENFHWLKASIHLLEEFERNNGKRAIMVGSCFEYNWGMGVCKEEITPANHGNLYGSTKNILKEFATSYSKIYNLEIVWPRLFFLYGPNENPLRLIPYIITSLLNNQPATIKNGGIYRDYMYVKDSVKILSNLLFHPFTGAINISTGIPVNLGELGQIIERTTEKENLLNIEYSNSLTNKIVYADIQKLHNESFWEAPTDITTGLKETINWWKNHTTKIPN